MRNLPSARNAVWAAAVGAVWLLAALHSRGTARRAAEAGRRLALRSGQMRRLAPAQERLDAEGLFRVRLLDMLQASGPFAVETWWHAVGQGLPRPDFREESRVPALGGRADCVTVNLEWPSVPLAVFGAWIARLESCVPPVRLASVQVDPLREEGFGKVSADLETFVLTNP